MNLIEAPVAKPLTITDISQQDTRLIALRLGIAEGAQIQVTRRVIGGPIIIQHNTVEIALGREFCHHIEVTVGAVPTISDNALYT